jgi:hypothetical protein
MLSFALSVVRCFHIAGTLVPCCGCVGTPFSAHGFPLSTSFGCTSATDGAAQASEPSKYHEKQAHNYEDIMLFGKQEDLRVETVPLFGTSVLEQRRRHSASQRMIIKLPVVVCQQENWIFSCVTLVVLYIVHPTVGDEHVPSSDHGFEPL